MGFNRHIAVELLPRLRIPPRSSGLLADFGRVAFAGPKCAAILRKYLEQHPNAASLLDPDSAARGDVAATHELLYDNPDNWSFSLLRCRDGDLRKLERIRGFEMRATDVARAGRLLRVLLGNCDSETLHSLRMLAPEEWAAIVDGNSPRSVWPRPSVPGIYRREHASIVIASRQARLVFDPICLSPRVPLATTVQPDADVDAVLISHSHADHRHTPSIIASTRDTATPVVVPRVPKATLLCPDLKAELQAVGQQSLDPPWGSTLRFGDIEVDVLPFYGEQPAADTQCPDPEVRNWGNCYRVNTPDFSALLLTDAGRDTAGSMVDVIAQSVAARGPVDVVLACMRAFLSPFEVGGLSSYWMPLPFSELERLHRDYAAGRLVPTTAGLETGGLAEICIAAKARMFAPYAQGFAGIGASIPAGGWGPSLTLSEAGALQRLATQLASAHASTVMQPWKPGDSLIPCGSSLRCQPVSVADRHLSRR